MRQFDIKRTPAGGVMLLNAAPQPPAPGTSVEYVRGNYRVFLFNDAGTLRYYSIDLTLGVDQEWTAGDHDPNEFSPADIAGQQFWLRSEDLVLSNGDPIATWPDYTGNGHDATQSSGANKPTYVTNVVNGYPVVRFNDTSDLLVLGDLSALFPTAATLMVVVNLTGAGSWGGYTTHLTSFDNFWRYAGDAHPYLHAFRDPRAEPTFTMPTTGVHVFILTSDASSWKLYQDGTLLGSVSAAYAAGTSHAIVNAIDPAADHVEVTAYNIVADAPGIAALTAYALAKYNF